MAPLSGIKVVEAANYIAGPYGGMILADLGASVTKVEPPRGDPYRRFGPARGDSSLLFRATNHNKTGVALDLKSDEGFADFTTLLSEADVLITNWRPPVAPSLGLTDERVRRDFPRLIWVRVSGYGQNGPRSELPAYDGIVQARSGSALSGGNGPVPTNNNVADKVSAMFAAQTATAALIERNRTGVGAICDVAMVDALAHFYGADISAGDRIVAEPSDPTAVGGAGADATFPTNDGFIAVSPVSGRQVRRALEAVGVGDRFGDVMSAEPDQVFATFADAIGPALLARPSLELESIFIEADVPAAALRTFEDHIGDEQTLHNETYQTVNDPELGEWLIPRFPAFFNGVRAETAGLAAPSLQTESA